MDNNSPVYRPYGSLGIIALESARELGKKVDKQIIKRRELKKQFNSDYPIPDTYIMPVKDQRFSNGEGKVKLADSVRGRDIFILCDIGNYSCTYQMYGKTNYKGPDEHFQDIKRTISAIGGKSRRISVIMPLLYASRQHKKKGRESLDCSLALQELERMGVKDILTFDVHDPNIQNAIPLASFDNIYPTYDIVKSILESENDLEFDRSKMLVVSPDTGAMDRAIYYASVLKLDTGLFYKRRDHTRLIRGKNPIITHEYIGSSVEGMDILIVDDMIASGESVLDIAYELKARKANRIYIASTFGLFTEGIDKFVKAYQENLIARVYSTNLTYIPTELKNQPWYVEVDMSEYMAKVIDYLNSDFSISTLLDATYGIKKLLDKKIITKNKV
ncbi:MAG: ribose-phosphate pyrophosphokinase [Clostridiales bacterium]|jgi:ribose-phosphate pyrophosphokinase|nr:ribose-phosphate pyrophosphokinase [Clostridiales bacterium]